MHSSDFSLCYTEEPIYCYTPHNFTRDQALYARGYCWTELKDALPGVDIGRWPSLFEHKFLPYALLAFAGIMYVPALGWEFLASTRLTSELNFLLQEIDNCYHRAAEGRAPKIEKQIQSKGPGITERERREIIENAEKEKSPEQNLFEKYLERRGRSNFLAKLYLARHLFIIFLSIIPITYLSTYYATQKQNEFTCALGEPPDKTSSSRLHIKVNCKLPSVQLQRIITTVDIVLLCFMNLIILINLIHLFIFRKSNFIFDKLNKVGIKTKKQWQKSQFCDINILAMFCNENRDHIKSLNRLDFITNESDLMYDNVVRQLLAALAQSNYDATPTMRDSGTQTVDPSVNPEDIDVNEQLIIKRPRKKMKWIPSTNPLPQPFKEQLATMKVEASKPEKPKPVRRKMATDSLIAPLLESSSKTSQQPLPQKTEVSALATISAEKKHARQFSLDVHPYILSNKKSKPENSKSAPIPTLQRQETGFLNQEETIISLVSSSVKDNSLPETCRTVPASGSYLTCNHSSHTTTTSATSVSLSQVKPESLSTFNRNPTHPLLHISTLYEDHEVQVSDLIDRVHSSPDPGEIISVIPPKPIMMATFEEPRVIVNSVEY
ncbi:pannexin-2 [Microcaecilia unicolor]|uniref:Pannexin-2 n=1 Tax=Microcaecilia unicolor TaxID=1415580 RepID=A0A6P7Z0M9_9AMPH|nr:pannexin-2 [Microcaecilia unicolor]